mgnify:CR=1 FL=1
MDVNRPESVQLVGDQPRQHPQRKNLPDPSADDEGQGQQHAAWSEQAAVEVDGSLVAGISPQAQTLLDALSAQIEPLRLELENTKASEARYKDIALQHSIMSIPNRREFLRELAHVLNHLDDLSPPAAFAIVHLRKADLLRRAYGRGALDRALAHAAALISDVLHPTDVAGSLCGNDFGIILLNGDAHSISEMSKRLTARFAEQLFSWAGGVGCNLEPVIGAVVMDSGWTVDQTLEHADRTLIGGLSGDDVGDQ